MVIKNSLKLTEEKTTFIFDDEGGIAYDNMLGKYN